MRTCLHVDLDGADRSLDAAELAADALWALGAVAIEERPARLVAGFADDDAVRAACAAIAGRWHARVVEIGDGWREALVAPPVAVTVGAVTFEIDPGRAFGDGRHPTTRTALDALASCVREGDRVLDVGCGSGVLSVAAARLGASFVVALDVEADAVEVTRDNARRNGVADVVVASTDAVADLDGAFDVVVANLGGRLVVEELAPVLAARTGRVLVVGGLLDDGRPPPVVGGLDAVGVASDEGWTTVVYAWR